MNITQSLQKWGNGMGVHLPKKVVEAAHIELDQPLAVSIRRGAIVLTPIHTPKEITLQSLLEGVSPQQIAGEVDWGSDVGVEKYE